jgi:hypothetical protein
MVTDNNNGRRKVVAKEAQEENPAGEPHLLARPGILEPPAGSAKPAAPPQLVRRSAA